MQFSYRVSEAEYNRAFQLRIKKRFGQTTVTTIMFWVFILVCLMMLWAVVQKSTSGTSHDSTPTVSQPDQDAPAPIQNRPTSSHSLITNVGPFVLIGAVWLFMMFQVLPGRIRRLYRKDPAMHGEFTVEVTPASLRVQNTAGVNAENSWNLYQAWREHRGIIVLLLKSGTYFILSIAGLSESQRQELRGILSSALPEK
jgi:hypothetical protein